MLVAVGRKILNVFKNNYARSVQQIALTEVKNGEHCSISQRQF